MGYFPAGGELCRLSKEGSVEKLREALARGVDRVETQSRGRTALFVAALHGHTDCVKLLLETGGANVEGKGGVRRTSALQAAASGGHAAALQLLLAHGADVNAQDKHSWTALHYACLPAGTADCVALLLAAGAVPGAQSAERSGYDSLTEYCVRGFRFDFFTREDRTEELPHTYIPVSFSRRFDGCIASEHEEALMNNYETSVFAPLHIAASSGAADRALLLLDAGAPVNVRPQDVSARRAGHAHSALTGYRQADAALDGCAPQPALPGGAPPAALSGHGDPPSAPVAVQHG